jgi:sec-independent protein translocase protein TatA
MFGLGAQELIIILAIIALLFGGRKIPELTKAVTQSIREIKGSLTDSEPGNNNKS